MLNLKLKLGVSTLNLGRISQYLLLTGACWTLLLLLYCLFNEWSKINIQIWINEQHLYIQVAFLSCPLFIFSPFHPFWKYLDGFSSFYVVLAYWYVVLVYSLHVLILPVARQLWLFVVSFHTGHVKTGSDWTEVQTKLVRFESDLKYYCQA